MEGAISETKLDTLPSNYVKLLNLLDDGNNYSITELCEKAEVSRQTYYNALRNEEFVKALFEASTSKIYAAIPAILERMVEQAKRGSFAHQKMLMEVVKMYQGVPAVAIQQNTTNNYNYSPAEILEEAYRLVAQDKGITVEELKS